MNKKLKFPFYAPKAGAPVFMEGDMFTTIVPLKPAVQQEEPESLAPSRHQVGTKSALSQDQVKILEMCREEKSLLDLMLLIGRKDRTKFRDQFLNPLLGMGLIEMTIPDKPNSRLQKYRLTAAGIEYHFSLH